MQALQVHPDGHFLQWQDGAPFFYLADTGWTMLARLCREEIDFYLQERAAKGFNVVQTMGIIEFDGLHTPNREGHLPLHGDDPTTPNEGYWELVDYAVSRAAELEIILAIVPAWGDKWYRRRGAGPEIFTSQNAFEYGKWLGARYKEQTVIWLLGGDREFLTDNHREITRQMARGIQSGDSGRNLISVHPASHESSSLHFHNEDWLDFSMWQSGHHYFDEITHQFITIDYHRQPAKPTLDGEPCYEDHPAWKMAMEPKPYFDDYQVRKAIYRAVFAGACGATYGANGVFRNHRQGMTPGFGVRQEWRAALDLPGSSQMQWLRRLIESKPYFSRVPRPDLVENNTVVATGDGAGSFALIYLPGGGQVEVKMERMRGAAKCAWFDPRNGQTTPCQTPGDGLFEAPDKRDWVLSLSGGE